MTLPKWAEAQLDTQERSIEKLKENNRKLSERLVQQELRIDVLETLNKNLEADITSRLDCIKRLEEAVRSRDTKIDDLDRANDRLSHELKERDQRINGLLAKLAVFERT
jgi:predicted RNase H-like nuclease (RuvC/YqgF family)